MWYSWAYNRISGFGGGILPPLSKTNTQIATPPEVEQLKAEVDRNSKMPPPAEKQPIQRKLETLHTNGRFPIPASAMDGINQGSGIWDQYRTDDGPESTGQGYETQGM